MGNHIPLGLALKNGSFFPKQDENTELYNGAANSLDLAASHSPINFPTDIWYNSDRQSTLIAPIV